MSIMSSTFLFLGGRTLTALVGFLRFVFTIFFSALYDFFIYVSISWKNLRPQVHCQCLNILYNFIGDIGQN